MEQFKAFLLGSGGIGGVQFIDVVATPTVSDIELIGKILIQLAIGIVTILGILKRKKPN